MSEPLLDRLLTDIEYEASTVDPWETNSSRSSTIRGLGSLTGRGIMAVGIGILRIVDVVTVRSAVTKLSDYQWDSTHLPMQAYQDMLEYQRPGLYPRDTNIAAWDLMLVHSNRGTSETIVKCLFQPEWSRTDVQIFIKQLAACALTGWTLYPHGSNASRLNAVTSNPNLELDERRAVKLHAALCRILFLLLKMDPSLIHEVFDIGELAVLLGRSINGGTPQMLSQADSSPTAYVLRGANSWVSHGRIGIMANYQISIEILEVFVVSFLPTASMVDLQDAAQCIVDALQTSAHEYDLELDDSSSALPALSLAVMLSTQNKELSEALLMLGVIHSIEQLWIGPRYPYHQDQRDQCLKLLGALTRHNPIERILGHLSSLTNPCFFVDDEDWYTDEDRTSLQYLLQPSSDSDVVPSYGEALLELALGVIHLSSLGIPGQPPLPLVRSNCQFLMDVILDRSFERCITPAIRAKASGEFLRMVLLPMKDWRAMTRTFDSDNSAQLTAERVVYEYICGGSLGNTYSMPEGTAQELKAMYRQARSFGYQVCNPVERLIQLLFSAAPPSKRKPTPIEARMRELYPRFTHFSASSHPLLPILMATVEGRFDFARGGEPLSNDELYKRSRVIPHIQMYLSMIESSVEARSQSRNDIQ